MKIDHTKNGTILVTATYCKGHGVGIFEAFGMYDTEEERDAVLATFPKGAKVRSTGLWTSSIEAGGRRLIPALSLRVNLYASGANGGKNETGIKRIRQFLKVAEVEYTAPYGNSFATLEDFLASL